MFDKPDSSKGVLRSEAHLTNTHQPEKPVGRESEVKRIADALRPITRRETPENLLLHGPAGVGKTTCFKHVLNKLDKETSARPVHINCWQYNTRSSLLTQLLIELGYPAPRKGKPVDELLSKIREWLDKKRNVVVALDEFDQLEERTEIIYDLQMLNEKAENKIGLLMISNRHPSKIELDPRSRSRLNCQTLQFEPYNATKLREILQDRVEKAFHPGSVTDDAIEKIARHVAEETGDCRDALDTLLRAGRKADTEGHEAVTMDRLDI